MSAPSSPNQAPGEIISSPITPTTRTVAIIKNHALQHRFEIELRISDAGFEIVKERQMEFDIDTDPDTLFELFGPDFESFAEGPVWVYVLERRRAVEVWHSLMGDPDPEVARNDTPNSIRALYGLSAAQNGVMGSPDAQTAEIQIQSIFASSPPFPTTDLPDVGHGIFVGSMRSVSSSVLEQLRNGGGGSEYTTSSHAGGSANDVRKPGFKARALLLPTVLRILSLACRRPPRSVRGFPSKRKGVFRRQRSASRRRLRTSLDTSVQRRLPWRPPRPLPIAPRMTRAASLRLGIKPEDKKRPTLASAADVKTTFDGVPGHKRRETIAVASTRPPTVAPRLNKSAALRASKDAAPPSSFMFRQPSGQSVPSRPSSRQSFNGTSSARPVISRPPSAAAPSRPPLSRTTSNISTGPGPRPSLRPAPKSTSAVPKTNGVALKTNGAAPKTNGTTNGAAAPKAEAPAKPRPRPSSLQAPTIVPRPNKSALLRAAKMAGAAVGGNQAKPKGAPPAPRALRA
ncbi:hypothetical protein LXA43DRAFT_1092952 [Ganoderma leucocontextum]|nr:hypothetical protein LXA43DRAFT_1092952 [Ganoderma leucocontextum]